MLVFLDKKRSKKLQSKACKVKTDFKFVYLPMTTSTYPRFNKAFRTDGIRWTEKSSNMYMPKCFSLQKISRFDLSGRFSIVRNNVSSRYDPLGAQWTALSAGASSFILFPKKDMKFKIKKILTGRVFKEGLNICLGCTKNTVCNY
jgi:hypothetical protein